MPPQDSEHFRWFSEQVQPHESALRAWLLKRFSAECDIDDVVQEAFVRTLRAHQTTQIHSPKAFLFTTAHNLAFSRVRRQRIGGIDSIADMDGLSVLDESEDIPHTVSRAQELELLAQAIQSLPNRCRQVITLRKIYGMPQKDVAAELGIAVHTVEAQCGIGLRKIAEFFERNERRRPAP